MHQNQATRIKDPKIKTKVNKKETLFDFAEQLAQNIVDYKGAFIHINYNANFDFSDFKVLPFGSCRVGKKDDKNYNGKILIKENWLNDKEKPNVIDVFNPNKRQ